jgi:hypothetical protein
MGVGAGLAGAGLISGSMGKQAANKAVKGTRKGIDAQERMYQQSRADLGPYRDYGADRLNALQDWLRGGGLSDPTMDEVASSPGYRTRQTAVENSAIARGGLLSGNAMSGLSDFGASEYDSAINRRHAKLNAMLSALTPGSNAAMASSGAAMQHGNALSQLYSQKGQQQAEADMIPLQAFSNLYGMGAMSTGKLNPLKW